MTAEEMRNLVNLRRAIAATVQDAEVFLGKAKRQLAELVEMMDEIFGRQQGEQKHL
jgi:hypothetical protein